MCKDVYRHIAYVEGGLHLGWKFLSNFFFKSMNLFLGGCLDFFPFWVFWNSGHLETCMESFRQHVHKPFSCTLLTGISFSWGRGKRNALRIVQTLMLHWRERSVACVMSRRVHQRWKRARSLERTLSSNKWCNPQATKTRLWWNSFVDCLRGVESLKCSRRCRQETKWIGVLPPF